MMELQKDMYEGEYPVRCAIESIKNIRKIQKLSKEQIKKIDIEEEEFKKTEEFAAW